MAQESLLQMLEEVASKVRLLEREKGEAVTRIQALERENREAVARTQTLEREVGELVSLITLAGEKVDEILKVGANDDVPQSQAVTVPGESKHSEQMGEFSADPLRELEGRFPHVFTSD